MGRAKQIQKLNIYFQDELVGNLVKQTTGAITFEYSEKWQEEGFKISHSLPLERRRFTGDEAAFYFDNLLPESQKIRDAIAEKFGAKSATQFDLLSAIGRDCIGALTIAPEEFEVSNITDMNSRAMSAAEIARRIRNLATDNPLGMEDDEEFRISLAGVQEKMALLKIGNKWHLPQGTTPTSHIFKKPLGKILSGIDLSDSVDNEWIGLWLSKKFNIESASAKIECFENQRILSVERFDRTWKKDVLYRLPQEDFCQSLGFSRSEKYEFNKQRGRIGPGIEEEMNFMLALDRPLIEKNKLFRRLMFFDLLMNPDSHAKNFSTFLLPGNLKQTPLYDVMSAHPLKYRKKETYDSLLFSLGVGEDRERRFSKITKIHWAQEAKKSRISDKDFENIYSGLINCALNLTYKDNELPKDLDRKLLDQILEGVRQRAKRLEGL